MCWTTLFGVLAADSRPFSFSGSWASGVVVYPHSWDDSRRDAGFFMPMDKHKYLRYKQAKHRRKPEPKPKREQNAIRKEIEEGAEDAY